jgi:hypothetical protein
MPRAQGLSSNIAPSALGSSTGVVGRATTGALAGRLAGVTDAAGAGAVATTGGGTLAGVAGLATTAGAGADATTAGGVAGAGAGAGAGVGAGAGAGA